LAEKKSIDAILDEFDVGGKSKERSETRPITIWIPLDLKTRYDELQGRTRGQFGKLLKEIVKRSIEKKAS